MYTLYKHFCTILTYQLLPFKHPEALCVAWGGSYCVLGITFHWKHEVKAVYIACSLLVPPAAVFTGDFQHAEGSSSAAPSLWAWWEDFQSTSPQGYREGAAGQGEHTVPSLCPAGNRQSIRGANVIPGNLGEAGTTAQLQELATGSHWNRIRYGGGIAARSLPKGQEWGECRSSVGNSSSSTCSGMHFIETAIGTKDRCWQWCWIGDCVLFLT